MLGDNIKDALESIGISSNIISRWLGRPCNCDERREKLNQLGLSLRKYLGKGIPIEGKESSSIKQHFLNLLGEDHGQ